MAILAFSYQGNSSQNFCVVREITGLQIADKWKEKAELTSDLPSKNAFLTYCPSFYVSELDFVMFLYYELLVSFGFSKNKINSLKLFLKKGMHSYRIAVFIEFILTGT